MEKLKLDDAKSLGNETWIEALARFRRLCHVNVLEYEDGDNSFIVNFSEGYDDRQLYEVKVQRSDEELRSYELKYGVSVPQALKKLLCVHGPFTIYWYSLRFGRWGEREFLGFYTASDTKLFPNIKPLSEAIAFNYGSYFANDCLTQQQVAQLDASYFAFGYLSDDDHRFSYLLFDTKGRFGTYRFDTEDYPESQSEILRLIDTEFNEANFDTFMVQQIDDAINYLLRYAEVLID